MLKKISFLLLFFITCITAGFAQQQLTRIVVVDLPRVYTEFFRESQAVRNWIAKSESVQRDIERMQRDIQDLQSRRADAILQNNQSEIYRLSTEIARHQENLVNFSQARSAELEKERSALSQSDTFMREVNEALRMLAESEGVTAVFNIKDTPGIIWYSPVVDYTDRLITRLRSRIN